MKKKLAEIGKKKTSPSASTSERKAMMPCTALHLAIMQWFPQRKDLWLTSNPQNTFLLKIGRIARWATSSQNREPSNIRRTASKAHEEAQADSRERHSSE